MADWKVFVQSPYATVTMTYVEGVESFDEAKAAARKALRNPRAVCRVVNLETLEEDVDPGYQLGLRPNGS